MKVIVDGLATEYKDEGQGPVLLMLHGWKDDMRTFDKLVGHLKGYRIIRLDMPGFGGTEKPKRVWKLHDYVQFVSAFIHKIGIHPDALVGHSMGGRVIIKGVSGGVLKAAKIVLISSAGIAKRRTAKNSALVILAKIGKAVTLIPPFSFWRQGLRRKLYGAIGSDYFAAGELKDTFLNIVAEDLSEAATGISVPALLIWGRNDAHTPLSDGQRLSKLIPNAVLKVLEGAAHFVHQESAEEVAELIEEFI